MKRWEQQVIAHMRAAIAHYHSDRPLAQEHYRQARALWESRKWTTAYAELHQQMHRLWWAYTPMPRWHLVEKRVTLSPYSYHVTQQPVTDTVQPPVPTTEELLSRFDQLIDTYTNAHPGTTPSLRRKREHGRCNQHTIWPD
ncbi:MAG TPA: hypothetical protein VFB60_11445 [Ktedonobacteraceae bacterium]|nr:hypothetical protein [Ktedonobacteraceae bacterium]